MTDSRVLLLPARVLVRPRRFYCLGDVGRLAGGDRRRGNAAASGAVSLAARAGGGAATPQRKFSIIMMSLPALTILG
jgi:hypothetical protein